MQVHKIVILIALYMYASVFKVYAQGFNTMNDSSLTDKKILEYCEPTSESSISTECRIFIESVVLSHEMSAIIIGLNKGIMTYDSLPLAFCVPNDISIFELSKILVSYINNKYKDANQRPPYRNTQFAAHTAVVAFSKKYPCHF